MYNLDELQKKWQPVLEHPDLPEISDAHKRATVATLLENQEHAAREDSMGTGGYQAPTLLGEAAPANATGGSIDTFDPVLISLVRRSMPNLIAYDVCGVQPMTGPTGLIFAMRSRYSTQAGTEALFNEANTTFSSAAAGNTASINAANSAAGVAQAGTDPADRAINGTGYSVSQGMSTADGEKLGDASGNHFQEMAFSIEKISVTAVSRALKAEYTMELAQDLKAIHGLDAETELSNILSAEILAEINREVVRTINYSATAGAQKDTTAAGTFDRLRSLRALCSRSNVTPTKLLSLLVAVRVMLCSARRMLLLHFRWLVFWITRLPSITTYRLMTRATVSPVFLMVA